MSTLIVNQDTIFKAEPVQSTSLSDGEKTSVPRGEYGIATAEKVGNHYKITLDRAIADRKDWYVFEGHVLISSSGTLVINQDTVFKVKPVDSSQLSDTEKVSVSQRELAVKSFSEVGAHLKVELDNPIEGRTEWYVFQGHIDTLHIESYAPPQEEITPPPPPTAAPTPAPAPSGRLIRIAGKGQLTTGTPIISGGNFTWGEATKDGQRLPENATITNNIIRMAQRMQEVRSRLGNRSITITSWYRPPAINRAVGGASRSTHIQGHGVDFVVAGLSPREVQRQLDPWWPGGLGYGSTFTHLDNRDFRARWNYGN
ncbi:MAG: DUF882 domain-containing protein [Spirulina sp. DLM2.Bin59]|nr:MAG: DUF882 domain-containing protein [Spirulina sp. DLM2.Bin59]